MATILVDYENVRDAGLNGIAFLNQNDSLYIFFSDDCSKINAFAMSQIEKNGCDFHVIKLKQKRKNGLDFYIAVKIGELYGQGNKSPIGIVSKDKGFMAVVDYCKSYEKSSPVFLGKDIEACLMMMSDPESKERRSMLQEQNRLLDLGAEYKKYSQKREFHDKLVNLFSGTPYACMIDKIMELFEENNSKKGVQKKLLYVGALKNFGRDDGRYIYSTLKDNLLENKNKSTQ